MVGSLWPSEDDNEVTAKRVLKVFSSLTRNGDFQNARNSNTNLDKDARGCQLAPSYAVHTGLLSLRLGLSISVPGLYPYFSKCLCTEVDFWLVPPSNIDSVNLSTFWKKHLPD